jgi:XTP/dITP diphosphohydrolase
MCGSFELKGKVIFFATSNIHKFNEARVALAQQGIAAGMLKAKALEIQSESLSEIAAGSVVDAYKRCHLPLIVEDAGLFIDALKGFPGPYAAYVYKTIGNSGLLKLLENVEDRKATFRSVIAFCDGENCKPMCFIGEVSGRITEKERMMDYKSAFGFDPIFQPEESLKAFAEMTIEEKNRVSHRAQAVKKFAEWYVRQGSPRNKT